MSEPSGPVYIQIHTRTLLFLSLHWSKYIHILVYTTYTLFGGLVVRVDKRDTSKILLLRKVDR